MEQTQLAPPQVLHAVRDAVLRQQLVDRRQKLQAVTPAARDGNQQVLRLLQEVDAALARMDAGTFGLCDTCHDPIENDRLLADPLCRNCIDHLSAAEQRALERDLDLAFEVQRGLLPEAAVTIEGWEAAYSYEPAGPVSGDYCDLIALDHGSGLFMLGDVAGKGVAASMLMAHLHAIFRSLVTVTRSVTDLVAKANRVFCQSTLPSHFATLVCGHLGGDGGVDICNAGHCLPLHVSRGTVTRIDSTGLPLGLFGDGEYRSCALTLAKGDSLALYSDGVSESFNDAGKQYGVERLANVLGEHGTLDPKNLLDAVLRDVKRFRSGTPKGDDLTLMVIRRKS
jgi:sigma-B regulation protein RsbU (phosphoserine phosphatase)